MDNDAQDIRLLIRSFVDSLNAFKASLDRHAEIIREYRESREAARQPENPPEPAKIIAELPPAIVSYYEAEQNVRRSAKWWKRVERGLAVLAFFAAVALATLTYRTLLQVKRQADAAQEQTRPWPNPSGKTTQTLVAIISLEITVKNIGKGVARDVFIDPVLMFYKWSTTKILANDEREVCTQATKWNPGLPFVWSSIFPNDARKSKIMTTGFYDEGMLYHPADRTGNWISE